MGDHMKTAKWENIVILFIGLWLFSIPWTISWGFGSNDINVVMWNFTMIGAVVIFTSVVALRHLRVWAEWLSLFMGIWLICSPLFLIYWDNTFMLWNSVACGIAITTLSALSIPIAEKQIMYNRLLRKHHHKDHRAIKH
jgi:hypothetical protein